MEAPLMKDSAVLIRQSRWLGRKKTSLCICCALLALSVFIIASPGGTRQKGREASYTVVFRHYGIDAREMERTAAIPLEDALAAIPGARSVLSSSENGQARVFVRFDRDKPGQYEAVREAAQTVYQELPSSAQRPEILSSGNSRIPLWSAAVLPAEPGTAGAGLAVLLERVLKPKLESLEGAGEVEIYGAGLQEFLIALKPDRAAALGLDPRSIAAALGTNDVLLPGGSIKSKGREILLTVDGRYGDSSGLAEALIPRGEGRALRLEEIADVYEQERVPDTISRLNGQKTAVISVMGSAGAEPGKLSRRIKALLDEAALPLELIILSDRGAEETAAYRSLLIAALEGSLMVALTAFLLGLGKGGGVKTAKLSAGLVCAFAVPGVCLLSAALLSLLGFSLDRLVLGGLSAGLGAAVDAAILCAGELRSCRNLDEARLTLGRLRPPLVAGSLTTAASLLPLGAVESMAGGITTLVWAIGLVNIVSLVLSLSLLPPLCLWTLDSKPARTQDRRFPGARFFRPLARRIIRLGCRFLAADLRFCARRPVRVLAAGILLSAAGAAAVIINGVDAGDTAPEDSVFARVEFEGGLRAEETDRLLAEYAAGFMGTEGIRNVQTGARTASGSVLFSFDSKIISVSEVRELARSRAIPGGFVFFPESSPGERIWEIKIKGDDDIRCRELAVRAAALCALHPLVKEEVLNFKEGSERITLVPDRERLLESGIPFFKAAEIARWGVHGPVAYKKTDRRGETDVRVRGTGAGAPSREEVLGTLILGEAGTRAAPRLEDLVTIREGREPSSIRREDRRRTASFSIRTKAMDPRRVRTEIMAILEDLEKPPGYTLEFDPEQIRRAEALSGTILFFLWALVFCYMVIAAAHESFRIPLAVLAVVPPSLAFPALCLGLGGAPLYPAAACAFVAVSGMAVNASVLSAGGLGPFLKSPGKGKSFLLYRGLRKIFPLLLATGGTTVAGALPFILLREGANTLVRTLSLVTALGVGASCLCSLCIVPALAVKYPKIFDSYEPVPKPKTNRSFDKTA
jgi:multidrug efflux pump subunit AcrB